MSLEKEEIKQAKAKRLQDIEENQKKFEEKQLDLDKNFLFHKEEFNNEKQSTTKRFQEFNEKHIDLRSNYLIQKEQFENEKLAVLKRFEEIEKLHKEEALGYETRARTKKFQEIEEEIKNEEVALAQRLHEIEENQKKIEQKQLDLDKNFLFHIQEFTNEKQATAKILREIKKKQKDFAFKLTTLMLGLIVLGIGILVMVNNQIEVIEPSELINTIPNKGDLNNETLKQDEPNNETLSLDEFINTIPNKDDLNNETLKQDETNNETLSLDELINDNPSIDKKSILISGSADDQVKKELYFN